MKKIAKWLLIASVLVFAFVALVACGKEVDFSINFIVDGEQYATVSTAGNETITMPENPTKGNYSFDGWYWDKDIWNTPFTANSLLDAPLSSDMSVYAKFTHNHDDSDWEIVSTVASTEETEGSITYSCTVCGATKTETIERLPHVHVYSEEWEKNETHHWHECAKDGDKSGYALHEWNSGTITKEATEDETGTKLYTCTVCGATKTEPVDKLPHTHKYSDVWTKDETYHWHSATCGHDVVSDKEMHNWNDGVITKEATEDETGTKLFTCTACGATKTEIIERLPHVHVYSEEWKKDETHHWHECAKDGDKSGYALHEWNSGTITKEATEDETGTKLFTCTVCGATKTEIIERLPHVHVYSQEWKKDETHHWHECAKDGARNNFENHTYDNGVISKEATEFEYGKIKYTCTVCGYFYEENTPKLVIDRSGAEIVTAKGFTMNGNIGNISLPNTTETYSFINQITVSDYATWVISTDIYGMNTVVTKTIPLTVGDNTAYLLVSSGDGNNISLYTMTVRRRPMYSVDFVTNGGTGVSSQTIEETYLATEPTTTRIGYTFTGWDYDFTRPILKNETVSASWTANTNTAYKVEYYLQNLEDDDYTLQETSNLTGTTDTTANAEIKAYEHFTFIENNSILSGNIDGNGSRVLKVYYTRDIYAYSVTNENVKGGSITCTTNGGYKFDATITLTTSINAGYDFLGWYVGDTQISEKTNYSFHIEQPIAITAKWYAHEDTAYRVEYYLQNLEDDDYTFDHTDNLTGTTDTTVNAEIKSYNHFTYNQSKSIVRGNIDGDGSRVLKVYYTRDIYAYSVTNENVKGGSITCTTNGGYKFDATITLTTSINAGYDFLGWYVGDTQISEKTNYSFHIEQPIAITAKWYAHENTAYRVEYYLQNLEDNDYTFDHTDNLTGTTDTTANADVQTYEHFTFTEDNSVLSGNIDGDGSRVLKVYYLRNQYHIVISSNENVTITNEINGMYKYGQIINGSSATFNNYLGYEWSGWTLNNNFLTMETGIEEFVCERDMTYIAKCNPKQEMMNFTFSSTPTTCTITGIKNKSVKKIIVSDYVTNINSGAFSGCSSLQSITIPFVGNRAGATSSDTYQYPFGYIFGTGSGTATTQYYYGSSTTSTTNTTYYIPSTLRSVTVTGGNILCGAFYNCSSLTSITIPDSVTSIGELAFDNCTGLTSITIPASVTSIGRNAFYNCSSLTSVYYTGDIASWCGITFNNDNYSYDSNPLRYAHNLYIDNELIKDIVIPDTVTEIKAYAFHGWNGTSITIPDSVTWIGRGAFSGCTATIVWENEPTITTIGTYAFSGYNGASITIPDSVTSIGNFAFSSCSSLTSVYYKGDIASWCGITFGNQKSNPLYYAHNLYIDNKLIKDIVIPDTVTEIKARAFYGWNGTSITIPASVTSIGENAFYNCPIETATIPAIACSYVNNRNLKTVVITSGESIGGWAFRECSSLTSITIPDSVTSIGNYAFYYCSNLTSITIPDSVTSIGGSAFYGCSNLTSITIPYSVTSIGNSAFRGCSSLTSITIPDSVTSIGDSAFSGCSSLTSITIPDSVMSIGNSAFYECSSLTSITIPDSVTSIGSSAFSGCSSLTSITIPDSVTSIGSEAFSGCPIETATIPAIACSYIKNSNLKTVVITSGTSIGYGVFSGCSSLQSITIPFVGNRAGVTSSDTYQYPFGYIFGTSSYTGGTETTQYYYGSSTTSTMNTTYYIPSTLKSVTVTGGYIPYGAFYNCSNLTSITIGNGVTSIGERAFYYCSSLTSVTIGNSVTSIGNSAFSSCSSLTSVYYAGDIASWCGIMFSSSTSNPLYYAHNLYINNELIKEIVIPDTVTEIKAYAFYDWNGTSITLGNSVTSIGEWAFSHCSSLTSITIPDSVTSIGNSAFRNCSGLTSITIPDSVTSIGNYAFFGCTGLTSITIPDSVTSIGEEAFSYCSSLQYNEYNNGYYLGNDNNPYLWLIKAKDTSITSCTIHEDTKFIYSYAFSGCSSLTSITIPDSVTSIGGIAFYECSSLTSITIPDSVTSIGNSAFHSCSSLTSVYYTGDIASWCGITFGNYYSNPLYYAHNLYINNKLIKDIVIPDTVTEIKGYAFHGWNGTSITLGNSVTSIGEYAFYGCSSLTSITIPDSVTSIGDNAFFNCSSLTSITFQGTKARWNAIGKGSWWNSYTGSYTVYCTNGTLNK